MARDDNRRVRGPVADGWHRIGVRLAAITMVVTLVFAAGLATPAVSQETPLEEPMFEPFPPDPEPVFERYVVRRGEWLWRIARARQSTFGRSATPQAVKDEVELIYQDNAATIGRNPNRLRPGQVLLLRTGVLRGTPQPAPLLRPSPRPCNAPPGSGCA